jgi:AcrR family transcriptional regulator
MTASVAAPASILAAAADVLARDPGAPVGDIVQAAGVSRATFYRHFHSRASLLEALSIEPDPDAHQRILDAAGELIGRDGLRGMSMDEVATSAGVSRASVYRLFPGKAALFEALVAAKSPFDEIVAILDRSAEQPPAIVLPAITAAMARVAADHLGLMRSLFFEVSALSPDALSGSDERVGMVLAAIGRYMARQMELGRLHPMHPLLAGQLLIGPIIFHLISRAEIERLAVLDVPVEMAIHELTGAALRALENQPDQSSPED